MINVRISNRSGRLFMPFSGLAVRSGAKTKNLPIIDREVSHTQTLQYNK